MVEQVRRRRRRAVVLGMPAAIVAVLAIVALWRIGGPTEKERGAAGTMGINEEREATLEGIEVRQLTSDRTFWAGAIDEEPIFVVSTNRVRLEPGARVSIVGRIAPVPPIDIARREWRVSETTAQEVQKRGVYLRASEIRPDAKR